MFMSNYTSVVCGRWDVCFKGSVWHFWAGWWDTMNITCAETTRLVCWARVHAKAVLRGQQLQRDWIFLSHKKALKVLFCIFVFYRESIFLNIESIFYPLFYISSSLTKMRQPHTNPDEKTCHILCEIIPFNVSRGPIFHIFMFVFNFRLGLFI